MFGIFVGYPPEIVVPAALWQRDGRNDGWNYSPALLDAITVTDISR